MAEIKSPLKGNYLINNNLARAGIQCFDTILKTLIGNFIKKNAPIETFKKILLCNTAHLGDCIITTSLLEPLKRFFPDCHIGMLVSTPSKQVIEDHPFIECIHTFDHWKLNRSALSLKDKIRIHVQTQKKACQEIKAYGYDLAIDCPFHFPGVSYLLWKAGIPTRIGFISAGGGSLLTHPQIWTLQPKTVSQHFLSLLSPLGIDCTSSLPSLPCNFKKIERRRGLVVIHPGAGMKNKLWDPRNWKSLCLRLLEDGHTLVFTGKGDEENKFIKEFEHLGKNLINQLKFNELAELIASADLLIGMDSSAGHIASATKTPAVLLYPGIHPAPLWHPHSPYVKILTEKMPCSPCYKGSGCQSMSCIQEISVETVYLHVYEMLKTHV